MRSSTRRRPLLVLALLLCLGALVAASPPTPTPTAPGALRALERAARPLRTTGPAGALGDLDALGRMVGDARVVGLGEATHSSHEFFTLKHRVLRYLVERKGFRAFALEGSWSTGLRLDHYVLTGAGDPRQIMRDEFQSSYSWWNNSEYLALIEWMRGWNLRHPQDPVRFVGDDFGWAGPELYDLVTDWVGRTHPELADRFTELYRGLRPTAPVGTYMDEYLFRPLAERKEMAARTGEALDLLRSLPPGSGAAERKAYRWAVQHATAIDQTAHGYSFDWFDQEQLSAAMRYRDRIMADNVAWWQAETGEKILLSAHNRHVAYESDDPVNYPKVQGAFLRDLLGDAYLNIGTTFDRGSFNATGPDGTTQTFTVGPASPGGNEALLDRVRHRDYMVDMRTAPPAARTWLATARLTKSIGTVYPDPERPVALGRSYDVLIHLHQVRAAELLTAP